MVSIWNLKDTLRVGYNRLSQTCNERFGTVVRSGKMDKTVGVLIERWRFNHHYRKLQRSTKLFHCHDEDNYCVTGDKVVIKYCGHVSPIKHHYVRSVVLPIGRNNSYSLNVSQDEINAMKYNEGLREKLKNRHKFLNI